MRRRAANNVSSVCSKTAHRIIHALNPIWLMFLHESTRGACLWYSLLLEIRLSVSISPHGIGRQVSDFLIKRLGGNRWNSIASIHHASGALSMRSYFSTTLLCPNIYFAEAYGRKCFRYVSIFHRQSQTVAALRLRGTAERTAPRLVNPNAFRRRTAPGPSIEREWSLAQCSERADPISFFRQP